jgi:aminopeptidase 2
MVTIEAEKYDSSLKTMTIELSQKRFLSTGDLTLEEENNSPKWFIPIGVVTSDSTNGVTLNLTEKRGAITFPYHKTATSFYKINANTTGFYRVCQSTEQLIELGRALESNIESFSTEDRIGIISDAFAMAKGGLVSTIGALEILRSFKHEENQIVLSEIASKFGQLKRAWYKNSAAIKGIQALQREIFSPKVG